MKHIVIIGGYFNRFDSFKDLDVEISLIQEVHMLHKMHEKYCNSINLLKKFECNEVLKICTNIHKYKHIDYIFSFIEEGLYPAAYVAKKLGLNGMDYDVHSLCLDKNKMRNSLKNSKFDIEFIYTNVYDKALRFLEKNHKIIIKDPSGCGSEHVYLCENIEELAKAWKKTESLLNDIRLIEEFLEGKEYSLETISLNGEHTFIGATKTYLYPECLVEQKHIFPAPDISEEQNTRFELFCKDLLDTIGFTHGPTHIEIKLIENDIKLIEINNRTAGGFIWQLIKMSSDVDMLTETIRNAFNNRKTPINHSSIPKDKYFASFVLYENVNTDRLARNLENVMDISTLYCEHSKNNISIELRDEINANDVLGFLVGTKKTKGVEDLEDWMEEVEGIIKLEVKNEILAEGLPYEFS